VKVVLGIKKNFYPPAFFYEGDVRIIIKNIAGIPTKGRSIYGFFVTEEEFNRLFPEIYNSYRTMPISEAIGKIFKKGSNIYMEELLGMHKVPIRKIRIWHTLGWSFEV
jgi:aldehyde:ferredoxin oxidoreductase